MPPSLAFYYGSPSKPRQEICTQTCFGERMPACVLGPRGGVVNSSFREPRGILLFGVFFVVLVCLVSVALLLLFSSLGTLSSPPYFCCQNPTCASRPMPWPQLLHTVSPLFPTRSDLSFFLTSMPFGGYLSDSPLLKNLHIFDLSILLNYKCHDGRKCLSLIFIFLWRL